MMVPRCWGSIYPEHTRDLWNPAAPDNMLVRHLALKACNADPSIFPSEQARIASLSRSRQWMKLYPPTDQEWEEFVDLCLAAGMTLEKQ